MRKLTSAEIQHINGSGSSTYSLPYGVVVTTTLMPNHSTTIAGQLGNGSSVSVNSGQQLAKTFIGSGVGSMAVILTGTTPAGLAAAGLIGMAASFGAGRLMNGVNLGG